MFDALGQRLLLNNYIQLQLFWERIILPNLMFLINQLSNQYLVIANYIAINWIIIYYGFFQEQQSF